MSLIFSILFLGITHIPDSNSAAFSSKEENKYGFYKISTTSSVFNVAIAPNLKTKQNVRKKTEELFLMKHPSRDEESIYFNNINSTFSPWGIVKLAEENEKGNDDIPKPNQSIQSWEEEDETFYEFTGSDCSNIKKTEITHELGTKQSVNKNLKHILLWTYNKDKSDKWDEMDFRHYGGQQIFIEKNCPYINCYITNNRSFIYDDFSLFDALIFLGPEVFSAELPWKRAPHQKYIFAATESSDTHPVCTNSFDGYFNWTWTYKIDSDARWGYIYVRDIENKIIGPKIDMHWIAWKDMIPIGNELKEKLKRKTKAVAWFVSNCWTQSHREDFVTELIKELRKYSLAVDIFGQCAEWECAKERHDECLKMLEKDYFFYLSFESGFSEDYVTEQLLHPLQSNTVPIVFGAANYTRFMPDGMYLNARQLGVKKLGATISYLMLNPEDYYDYFRWKNHYIFHGHKQLDVAEYCKICTMLNDVDFVTQTTIYEKFKDWWNPFGRC